MSTRLSPPTWRDTPPAHGMRVAAWSELWRFDSGAFVPLRGLRVAAGVVLALIVGLAIGDAATGATMAAGALLAGVPSVVIPTRPSLGGLVGVSLAMALAVFLGSVTGDVSWLHILVLGVLCLGGGLLLGQAPPAGSIGSQAILAMIVFGRFAAAPLGALSLAGYVLAGSAVAVAVLATTRPPLTAKSQRAALAEVLRRLAATARAGGGQRNGITVAEAIESAEALLARPLGDRREHEVLRALLDVLARARLALLAIDGAERQLVRTSPGLGRPLCSTTDVLVGRLAEGCESIAATLTDRRIVPPPPSDHSLEEALAVPDDPLLAGAVAALREHVSALAGQLRAATDLAARAATVQTRYNLRGALLPRRGIRRRADDALEGISADATLSSPVGRHAVRLAVAICAADAIARTVPLERSYWVALTAAIVLRPEFSATLGRGLARTMGTSLGAVLAGLLALTVHRGGAVDVAAIGVLCALCCATFRVSYVLFSGLITGLVVLLLGLVSTGTA